MQKAISFILLTIISQFSFGQEDYTKKLNQLFTFYEKQNLFNGSVLVSKKGQILIKSGFGIQNMAKKKKNDANGIFQIYSVTKTFTSCVILKLVEEGKLSLNDKLSKFYPDFPEGDSITIENLLTHTSGIYDYTNGNNMPDYSEDSFIAFLKTQPLDFPVGTNSRYSNSGYYLLGFIIQKVTGISYEQTVANYIFKPLAMRESGFTFNDLTSKNKVVGYEIFTKKIQKATINPPSPFSVGGIYSTIEDLFKYYNGLKSYKILKKETLEKAYTAFKNEFGYAWIVMPMFNRKTVGHSGAYLGFRSNFVQVPEDDICIILLANCENDLNNITGNILKILYNKPVRIPKEIALKKEILEQYKGSYQVDENFIIYVTLEDGKLMSQPKGQPKAGMYSEKENLFYVMELNDYIRFEKNKIGQIDTLKFMMQGQELKAIRINPAWGIIGNATTSGWEGKDIKLKETDKKGIWTIKNITLSEGELKFRFNSDWTINLGDAKNGTLSANGENIKVKGGSYDIVLDVTDGEKPTYKILKTN
jgi:CubicO group peptidase (beta-lactamase class C family)